jgi:hypothetical protein
MIGILNFIAAYIWVLILAVVGAVALVVWFMFKGGDK